MASPPRILRLLFLLAFVILVAIVIVLPYNSVDYIGKLPKRPAALDRLWSQKANTQPKAVVDSPQRREVSSSPFGDSSLGDGSVFGSPSTEAQPKANSGSTSPHAAEGYEKDKIFFELDLIDYQMPKIDISNLRRRPAHNYEGAGNPTFALFFMSRNSSLQDPYFLATHQVIYRLIWKEDTKSEKHPVTVFVPPWVSDVQRAWFQAVGALVREVDERPFEPDMEEVGGLISHRFRDVFSKLDMWRHIEFSRILFLDSDAFPLVNVDALLTKEMAPDQQCTPSLMFKDHPVVGSDSTLCNYVFTGAQDLVVGYMTNVGVMIFKPNRAMHELLIRQYTNTSTFHDGFVEQAFLSHIFREEGPFPVSRIDKAWNGDPEVRDSGHDLFIVHAKLWAVMFEDPNHWAGRLFYDTWANLTTFYESPAFQLVRSADGPLYGVPKTE